MVMGGETCGKLAKAQWRLPVFLSSAVANSCSCQKSDKAAGNPEKLELQLKQQHLMIH